MNTAPERIDMAEMLRRGDGRLLCDGADGMIVLSTDGTLLMSDMQDGALLCERVRTLCPVRPEVYSLKSESAAQALILEFSLHGLMCCTQWVYEKREAPFPVTADIRPLTETHADLAASVYHDESGEYIRDRITHGVLWGLFEGGELAGFAGFHGEGSMGLLEILPPFRRRGYAVQLEAFLLDAALREGRTPYCHVVDGNEASLHLQQKMGLTCTSLPAIWVD